MEGYKFEHLYHLSGEKHGGVGIFYKEILPLKIRKDLCFDELVKYMKMDHKSIKTKILKSWTTWDNYSLSIIYLKFIMLYRHV